MTIHGRLLLVRRVREAGWRVVAAAMAAGVSERTGYTWLARYRAGGERALHDRSSAPARSPHRLPAETIAAIERLRRQRWSGPRIARALGRPVSTVGTVLRRLGLGRLSALEAKPPAPRYERGAAGELLHIDSKKLARIAGFGHRVTGDRRHRARGLGWEHLHVAIDDASRLAYTELLPDERGPSCAGFLARAAAGFASLGIRIERVMTDNAFAYTQCRAFKATLAELGARHLTTGPTGHAPTARPSASSRPRCANGSTPVPTPAPRRAPPPCRPGCTGTITTDPTPASMPPPLPADGTTSLATQHLAAGIDW
jgi:transposase